MTSFQGAGADTFINTARKTAMQISPISLSQTLRPIAPVISQIGRVEKRSAPEAVAGKTRVSATGKNAAAKNNRTGAKRRKMGWEGLGETVDVFA